MKKGKIMLLPAEVFSKGTPVLVLNQVSTIEEEGNNDVEIATPVIVPDRRYSATMFGKELVKQYFFVDENGEKSLVDIEVHSINVNTNITRKNDLEYWIREQQKHSKVQIWEGLQMVLDKIKEGYK